MKIWQDYDLTNLNTFGVPARARYFVEISSERDLIELLSLDTFKQNPKLFLGGGSNILFTKDFEGMVVLNKLKGISILQEAEDEVLIKSMSGEVWHDLVDFSVKRGYWGIENLSWVPGTVGGAPMQNIGAYGVELAETLDGVEVFDIETGQKTTLSKEDCGLGYRDSVFKGKMKGKYFINAIILKLSKKKNPQTSYRVLSEYLQKNNVDISSPSDVSGAVIDIRKSKLPDPRVLGNAGSFFKNVFVSKEKLNELLLLYPDLPNFEENGGIKIPAGWLIEHSGPTDGVSWKGHRSGPVGVHDKQALVLVNHGGATGQEIKNFASQIIDSVHKKFGLVLVPEVNFI